MKHKERLRYVHNHSLEDTPEKAVAPTPALLPGKSHERGAW